MNVRRWRRRLRARVAARRERRRFPWFRRRESIQAKSANCPGREGRVPSAASPRARKGPRRDRPRPSSIPRRSSFSKLRHARMSRLCARHGVGPFRQTGLSRSCIVPWGQVRGGLRVWTWTCFLKSVVSCMAPHAQEPDTNRANHAK